VLTQDEETYVRELLAGLNAYPAYYAHMAPANSAGPSEPDLSPPGKADPAGIRRRIDAGEWAPGAALPSIAALAAHYGVSRATVAKAVHRLAGAGLLEVVPQWGVFRTGDTADSGG